MSHNIADLGEAFGTDIEHPLLPVFEAMADGVWVCDATPRLLWINSACEALNNIKRDEVVGRTVSELLGRGNFDTDVTQAIANEIAGLAAVDPDIGEFVERGGKLLLWHGWLDGLISPQNTIDYYNDVLATVGTAQARDSVRLFMSPGVNHCGGGEGPSEVDYLSVLEAWAEDGVVPERMITSKRLDDSGKLTRPLCAYPLVARYKGTGDTNDAANFDCN